MEDWITTEQAAKMLGISRHAVWRLVARGTLGARRVGRAYVLSRAKVEAYRDDPARLLRTRRPLTDREMKRVGELILSEFEDTGLVTRARNLRKGGEE